MRGDCQKCELFRRRNMAFQGWIWSQSWYEILRAQSHCESERYADTSPVKHQFSRLIIYVLRISDLYNINLRYLVDCEWGEWKTTVNCTDACGGKKHLEREQAQGAMYGGKQCETKPGHTQILKCCDGCKDKKCPSKMLPFFVENCCSN